MIPTESQTLTHRLTQRARCGDFQRLTQWRRQMIAVFMNTRAVVMFDNEGLWSVISHVNPPLCHHLKKHRAFTFACNCSNSLFATIFLGAFSTQTICLQFDLFHYWIIWCWPLTFSQDRSKVIDRLFTVAFISAELLVFSNPNTTLINLCWLFHTWNLVLLIFLSEEMPNLFIYLFWSLTDGEHENIRARIIDFFILFCLKDSPYSPTVIVSAGVEGNTQKI